METRSTLTETRKPGAGGRPFLLVLGPGVFSTYELPECGKFMVGRGPNANVWIDDPLLSHDHASITLEQGCFVEDLGSRNGTFLHQRRLKEHSPERLEPGVAVAVGSCLLVVQAGGQAPRARRLVSYGFFRIRLDEELARARHEAKRRFCIARVQLPSRASIDQVQELVARVLRPFDTVSVFAPDEYTLLFSATRPEEARALLSELSSLLTAQGHSVRSGLARYPEDGSSAAELEAHCLRVLRPKLGANELESELASHSPAMLALYRHAERIAQSQLSVLISGESGAGKDVLARFIHARSARANRPFQVVNCAALPAELLEAQLFGHERGAFTGAVRDQKGLIEAAEGGTAFLDEIAEVPLTVQAKLLRLLENREIQVVGASRPQKVDVRFIAATNVDLVQATATQRFRADLLYRLKGVELHVPALRERPEDLLPLANNLLKRFAVIEELERVPTLSAGAEARLAEYQWPGNVRELANVLHRAVVLSDHQTVTENELLLDGERPPAAQEAGEREATEREATEPGATEVTKPSRRVANPSKQQVIDALVKCAGNQRRTAETLNLPRKRLRDLIEFYGLPLPRG